MVFTKETLNKLQKIGARSASDKNKVYDFLAKDKNDSSHVAVKYFGEMDDTPMLLNYTIDKNGVLIPIFD